MDTRALIVLVIAPLAFAVIIQLVVPVERTTQADIAARDAPSEVTATRLFGSAGLSLLSAAPHDVVTPAARSRTVLDALGSGGGSLLVRQQDHEASEREEALA